MNSASTRPLTRQDQGLLHQGLALLNRTQGQGLFDPDYLESRIGPDSCLVVAAFLKDELVGLATAQVITDFEYYLPFDSNIARELRTRRVASFETSSVVEELQGHGIGRLLMERRLNWAIQRSCDLAIGVSWVSGLEHTSRRTFEGAGFRAVREVEGFYRETSIAKPFDCPGCSNQPCACAAILYRKDLTSI